MNKILETRHLVKTYKNGSTVVHALDDVSFSISQGDLAVILGKSGSGKSTLLDTIGGIEKPDQGEVLLNGISLYELRENERANIRSSCIGYIFQTFNLIEELTALENIRLPQDICGRTYEKQLEQDICSMLEIEARLYFYPDQLSGGERQRVAIARALLMKPQIVLADEPTGNLDSGTARQFMEFVRRSNAELGQTFVVVTHDKSWLDIAKTVYWMKDGSLEEYEENEK